LDGLYPVADDDDDDDDDYEDGKDWLYILVSGVLGYSTRWLPGC
jgi:hypothetical protein